MFEKFNTPEEIFTFKLGAALSMENTVLEQLKDQQAETNRDEIRQLLAAHAAETERHIANLERSFELLGEDVDDSPCPAIDGLHKEGKAALKKTADELKDATLMSGLIETEHHEIAVYEVLVTNAEARGAVEVAALLQQNLDDELRTLAQAKELGETIAKGSGWAVPTA